MSMSHFLDMGGYAAFVWPAYGLSALGVGGLIWLSLRARTRTRALLARLESAATERNP